jgi:hypothetical protein
LVLPRKLIGAPDSSKKSKYEAAGARTGTVSIFKNFPPKQHLHEPRVVTEAAESQIAQTNSQSTLDTPRREYRKIQRENEILKAKEHATGRQQLQIYRLIPKNIYQNLVTISL